MCGRYGITYTAEELMEIFELVWVSDYERSYNVAPTTQAPVIAVRGDDGRGARPLQWGLVPSWAKDEGIGARMINARVETAPDKPAFRAAFAKRRCIVPATGFYEWRREGKDKQPYWVHDADGGPLAMAGLWEAKRRDDGEWLRTFSILTRDAAGPVADIHHRMPVLVPREAWEPWLDPGVDAEHAARLIGEPLPVDLAMHAVDRRVGNPRTDGPELIEPIDE